MVIMKVFYFNVRFIYFSFVHFASGVISKKPWPNPVS